MKKTVNAQPGKKIPTSTIGFLKKHEGYVTVYIGNLSFKKTASQLKVMCEKYGPVSYVNLIEDPETKNSKGYAFIEMKSKKVAEQMIKELNGSELDGRTLKMSLANSRFTTEPRPRSKKENKTEVEEIQPKKNKRRRREKGLDVLKSFLNSK